MKKSSIGRFIRNYFLISLILISLVLLIWLQAGGTDYLMYSPDGYIALLRIQDFVTLFLSLVIQAIPFVVLGVGISVFIAMVVKDEWVIRYIPRGRIASHIFVSLFGVVMPVCECGNLPVARRLMLKGFTLSQSVTFLLAAPILNPVTLLATNEAFGYDPKIVVIRMFAGFVIANSIGIFLSYFPNQNSLMSKQFSQEFAAYAKKPQKLTNPFSFAIDSFQQEFIAVMRLLILGAGLAALSRTFIPQHVIAAIGQNPALSVFAMLLLAFVVSVCSSVDAFLAYSYAGIFSVGSLVTFMLFGPMIDMKVLSIMKNTYSMKLLLIITVLAALAAVIVGLIVNLL